jgi:hypothetical protein
MDELIGSYVNDTDPLKRAQYWLWSLAWRNGDKSNMLQVLSKEVEAERMKRDALAADNARLRERADAAEGLVRVATELTRNASGNTGVQGLLYISEVDFARLATALAAYKQAQGKGG